MKLLKILGIILLLLSIIWIIFSSRHWGDSTQGKSTFLWEQSYDNLCWKQYLGIKINNKVLFKIPGKTTKCI